MMSAEECIAVARAVAKQGETTPYPYAREAYLNIAERWLDLSMMAELQDSILVALGAQIEDMERPPPRGMRREPRGWPGLGKPDV